MRDFLLTACFHDTEIDVYVKNVVLKITHSFAPSFWEDSWPFSFDSKWTEMSIRSYFLGGFPHEWRRKVDIPFDSFENILLAFVHLLGSFVFSSEECIFRMNDIKKVSLFSKKCNRSKSPFLPLAEKKNFDATFFVFVEATGALNEGILFLDCVFREWGEKEKLFFVKWRKWRTISQRHWNVFILSLFWVWECYL